MNAAASVAGLPEVVDRALRLGTPQRPGRKDDLAEGIAHGA